MKYFVLMTGLLLSLRGPAQTAVFSGLDNYFDSLFNANKVMGSIAISKSGKIVYTKATGYRLHDAGESILSDEKTKYRIGSITKMFTATIIFQLIEEGKLSLETPLAAFFPRFPHAELISIGHLLNHRSGIRNYTKIRSPERPRLQEEMIGMIAKSALRFVPGTRALYSNANYLILGYIIEQVLAKPFEKVLEEKIVAKIGLANTYYGHITNARNNESFCYKFDSDWIQQPSTDLSIPGASGSILSTPAELTLFIQALFSGKLVSAASLEKMKTVTDDYGMGVVEFEFYTKKAYGQIGGIDHFESVVGYFPADSLAIAFCTNGHVETLKTILLNAINLYFGYHYDNPFYLGLDTKPKGLLQYVGVYSAKEIPLRLIITKDQHGLVAQPEGHAAYLLEADGTRRFRYAPLQVVLSFNTSKTKCILRQGQATCTFIRTY